MAKCTIQHQSWPLSIMIWENNSFAVLSGFSKAVYCEQLFWGSRVSRQLHHPHKSQLLAGICDMGVRVGLLILSLIKSAFCFEVTVFIKLSFFLTCVHTHPNLSI